MLSDAGGLIIPPLKLLHLWSAVSIQTYSRSPRPEMSFKVFLSENNKYIICRVSGPMTVDTATEFAKEMDFLSRAHGIKRLLTDVRDAPNTSSVMDNHNFTQSDPQRKSQLTKIRT
jgi:hypothetical protein